MSHSPDSLSRPPAFRRLAVTTLVAIATAILPLSQVPASAASGDNPSLRDLQRQRDANRRRAAAQASQVNALKASDAEVSSALEALTANVSAQRDKLEEAERAVDQAKSDQVAAEAAQAAKQKELDELVAKMKDSAVKSFISMDSSDAITVSSDDINDTVYKRALMSVRATQNISLTERFRSVQAELELQRQNATEASQRAETAATEVSARLTELDRAHAEQQKFADQVDARLDAALAEADALQATDATLAKSISSKQAQIARALAEQRAAAERRAAMRRAQNRPVVTSGNSGSSGSGAPVSITGSGEIVTVGGIRIHRSMADNLSRLLSAAAADGIHLGGGGFRDPAGQIAVRRSNCGTSHYAIYQMPASSCSPPTARPGSSMHERGLAVDFTQGGRALSRSSSGYSWMRANAGRYGFHNLPSEAWHWSTNGN